MADGFRRTLASRRFFWIVMAFFVFEGLWIAFSAIYPQAFDEDFHFGLIQAYSHYWLPFLGSPPPGAEAFGAMTRDPSYMYHYLFSFVYRLVALFFHTTMSQVIALRVVNVALFASGLILFRKLLRRAGVSPAATHTSILIMALIPIVPQVAGQINYDNLLMPLVAVAGLLTLKVGGLIGEKRLSLTPAVQLLALCFFTTIVKYEFAPIFLSIVLFLGWRFWSVNQGAIKRTAADMWRSWARGTSLSIRVVLVFALLVSVGLFLQRDGYNVVKYHTIAPECGKVLSRESCSAYPVWLHDYTSHQQVVTGQVTVHPNPIGYVGEWVYWLWYRLFFVINGPYQNFQNYPPLPLPVGAFAVLVIASAVALIVNWRTVFSKPEYVFLGLMTALYLGVLLAAGYMKYRQTAVLELMNGRYLLPVLLPGAALGIRALSIWLKRRPQYKTLIAAAAIVLFIEGGGVFSFILRSDPSWYWSSVPVVRMNDTARRVLSPVIFEQDKEYHTYMWFFN